MEKINLKLAEVVSLAIELNGNPQNPESEYKGILNEKMSLTTRYWLNQINKEVSEEKVVVDKFRDELVAKYGDTNEDLVENISQNIENSGKNSPKEEEMPVIVENNPQEEGQLPTLKWEDYMHPDFPWSKKQLWINNPKAVQYWINTKKGSEKEYTKIINEQGNTKTY
jgi:hypothetical protein